MDKTINKSAYSFSKKIDGIQTIMIFLISFLVPAFLGQFINIVGIRNSFILNNSQIIIGSIVNTALIITAINLKGYKKIIGVITMPSVASLFGGFVLKTASIYTVYIIPFIWVGNFALVYLYKNLLFNKNQNYFITGIISIISKVAIIFVGFLMLKAIGVFPDKIISVLQISMGTTQIITASIGMTFSFVIYSLEKSFKK